jgi:hypothetical protein
MPLPTISSEGYREEPLATSHYMSFLQNHLSLISEFYPFVKYQKEFENIPNIGLIDDYVKYIKVCVYNRKISQ